MADPSDPSENVKALFDSIRNLQTQTHAAFCIVGAEMLADTLRDALTAKMRPLNSEMKKRLFEGYGPLSTFAAKIDLSYALQIVPKEKYDDMRAILKIRNAFAHSTALVNFSSPEVQLHFKRLTAFDEKVTNYPRYFVNKVGEICSHLMQTIPHDKKE